jgi:hypothetical protein
MEPKDYFTLVFSLLALGLSIFALFQRVSETKRMIRTLLADIVSKLLSAETEMKKLDVAIRDAKEDTTGLRSIRNTVRQQRDSMSRQAHYLIMQIPKLVSDIEYAAVARALAVDDPELADKYWNRAIELSRGLGLGKHRKSYAQFLYAQREHKKGHAQFQEAVKSLVLGGDNHRWETMWTYLNWAECAGKRPGSNDEKAREVEQYFQNARKACEELEEQIRKREGFSVIAAQEKKIAATRS